MFQLIVALTHFIICPENIVNGNQVLVTTVNEGLNFSRKELGLTSVAHLFQVNHFDGWQLAFLVDGFEDNSKCALAQFVLNTVTLVPNNGCRFGIKIATRRRLVGNLGLGSLGHDATVNWKYTWQDKKAGNGYRYRTKPNNTPNGWKGGQFIDNWVIDWNF